MRARNHATWGDCVVTGGLLFQRSHPWKSRELDFHSHSFPVRLHGVVVLDFFLWWRALALLTYLTPKSSTTCQRRE